MDSVIKRAVIETNQLLIRQFQMSDTTDILSLSKEESLRTWLPSQVYQDATHARSVLEFLIAQYSIPGHPSHGPYVLAIEHRIDKTLVGHVGFSPLADGVEIGFAIAQLYQNQGLATEAIVVATNWIIERFGIEKIIGITSVNNVASKRALARARYNCEENRIMKFQGVEQEVSVFSFSKKPAISNPHYQQTS